MNQQQKLKLQIFFEKKNKIEIKNIFCITQQTMFLCFQLKQKLKIVINVNNRKKLQTYFILIKIKKYFSYNPTNFIIIYLFKNSKIQNKN